MVNQSKKKDMDVIGSDTEWETEFLEEDNEAREFFAGTAVRIQRPEHRVANLVAEFENREPRRKFHGGNRRRRM